MLDIRPRLDARLPATPCTPEMRKAMEELAKLHRCDLAELQRAAFALFLRQAGTKRANDGIEDVEKEKAS